MIDTLRLSGPAGGYLHEWDYTKYYSYKNKKGDWETTETVEVKKTDKYRLFYRKSHDRLDVELNVGKILFPLNCYNFAQNEKDIEILVRAFHGCFFAPSCGYVSRVDLGAVRVYDSHAESVQQLERYKRARFMGGRMAQYKSQNYEHSAFYRQSGGAFKVYHKGFEQKLVNKKDIDFSSKYSVASYGVDLTRMLRFEKTYRSDAMKRLGMTSVPYMGIPIDSFDAFLLVNDFWNRVLNWDFADAPSIVTEKRILGICQMLDQNGLLSDAEKDGLLSRSTLSRFRKLKKQQVSISQPDFFENIPEKSRTILNNVLTFGHSYLTHLIF